MNWDKLEFIDLAVFISMVVCVFGPMAAAARNQEPWYVVIGSAIVGGIVCVVFWLAAIFIREWLR